MSDRDLINNLLSQYCLLSDEPDRAEDWARLFADDATFTVLDKKFHGRDIVQFMVDTRAFDSGKHLTLNAYIEVDGDTATSISDFLYVGKAPSGQYSFHIDPEPHFGRYYDRLKKVDGRWVFAEREVQVYNRVLISQIIADKLADARARAESATA